MSRCYICDESCAFGEPYCTRHTALMGAKEDNQLTPDDELDTSTTVQWNSADDVQQILLDLVHSVEKRYGERYLSLASPQIEKAKAALSAHIATQNQALLNRIEAALPNKKTIDNVNRYDANTFNKGYNNCLDDVRTIIGEIAK